MKGKKKKTKIKQMMYYYHAKNTFHRNNVKSYLQLCDADYKVNVKNYVVLKTREILSSLKCETCIKKLTLI